MSTKVSGFTVSFDKSVSEEYMAKVKEAIWLMQGVINIDVIEDDYNTHIGAARENIRIRNVIIDLIQTDFGNKK